MSANRRNETIKVRNAWVSAVIFIIGATAIGIAYARLLKDGLPVDGTAEEMNASFLTTGIVVVGTILFFSTAFRDFSSKHFRRQGVCTGVVLIWSPCDSYQLV